MLPIAVVPAFRPFAGAIRLNFRMTLLPEGDAPDHPDMPEFAFDAGDVGAIIAFLKSIQPR